VLAPHGVAADRGNHHAAQYGEQGERIDEGNIRMPVTRPGDLAVDVEDRLGAGDRRYGRVRNKRAQEPCQGLVPGFVEMALAAEKHDAMAQQGIANGINRLDRQIAGQPYTMDFSTDRRRDQANVEDGVGCTGVTCRGARVRHDLLTFSVERSCGGGFTESLCWPPGSPCPISRPRP
jgi:hypothetical protein